MKYILAVVATLAVVGCDALLDVDINKPPVCNTVEEGQAWSEVDSAYVNAIKVYICDPGYGGGWMVEWCWFEPWYVEGNADHARRTCRALWGWDRTETTLSN